jgi:serine/threonine-protein phosphatase 6 regulatory ankyrin repeat subunit B
MCALFALKFSTSDIVADFEMITNSNDCGDFDDVALKVTFVDGQSQIFLLQLKHSENMKNVNDEMFAAENGDFSLQKYMRSISKLENTENVSFILYTNKSTSIGSKSTIDIKNEDKTDDKVVVTELQDLDSEKLLLWSKNENPKKKNRKKNRLKPQNQEKGTNVFQFELNQSSGSVESLDDYLKRFYFFAHQTDVTGAQSLINAILKKEYGITDATCSSSLLQFMETWWSSNFILTKYDVIAKLAELTLTPFIQTISDSKCNEKSKLLKEAIMKFDMTFVRDTNDEVVGNIWNETVSDEEISFTSLKYYGLCVEGIKDLSPNVCSKVLWHLNKVPLIVKAEECRQEQVKQAIRLLEKIKKRKVVLLANATKEEFPQWRIFQDLSDIQNEGVYTDIVKHFAVSLQGRQQIFLHQLRNFNQENARIIETTELIKMTQEVVQIGRKQEEAFENYIPRSVSTISLDIKKMSEFCRTEDSLLIICNVSQPWNKAIRQLNLHVMELDQYLEPEKEEELSKVDVLLTSNKWPHVRFDEICKKTKKNVHLLQVFDDKSCTSVLSKRDRFSLETMISGGAHVDEMEIFTYLDHPLNVICSPPGMGKSTLVSRLTSICPSSYWSVRVNLINHKTVFKNKCAHNEILHHFFEEEEDSLVVNIRSMLLQNKRMYLFLDGLDEIDSDCIPIALQFIQHISSLGHRVLITSRENLEQTVSHELNIFPIKIEELTEEQQREYIQKRLQDFYQEDVVEHIINKIYENVDIVNSRHLLGIPLQLFMITENFLNNKNLWTESDQEIFVLTKMYKIFFQGKKKHQHRKLGVHEHEDQLGFDINLYLEQYELLALKSCLDTTTFDKLKINLGRSKKFLEKLKIGDPFGIVSRVTDDNQAIFNHQTYAEYFACAWMKNNLDKVSLLQDDLFSKKNQNLRLIFDIMMAENSALHLAVIYRHIKLVSKHLNKREVKDECGRSPLQLLCTYGVEHPLLQINKRHNSKEFYIISDIKEVSTQYREIFKMLLHRDVFQNDNVFQWTCLEFAIRLNNLFAVEKILERFGDSINLERLFECYDIGTLAIYSSQKGYPNLLHAVIKKESNVLSVKIGRHQITLLHVAVNGIKVNMKFPHFLMEERKKVIRTLMECGLDVDQQCNRKRTPLHFAANDDVIAKILLDLGANINATDSSKSNVLHHGCRNSKVNTRIVKLLIDKGIDVNGRDCNQRTPLHHCCRKGHHDALVILLECGTNINAKDSMNHSPLYDAISRDNYNCVKVLLEHGADINSVDNSGKTVLHAAFETYRKIDYDCIKMLLDHGADINSVDNSGKTVLHAAFETYRMIDNDCIKMLLDHGADINSVDNSGKTVLHAAFETYRMIDNDCIKMLLDHGADINAVDNSGKTVLHAACKYFRKSSYDCIKTLLDHGADINAVDNSGKTVLHAAFETYRKIDYDCIKMLLDHGADINAVDNSGKTVLHAAFETYRKIDYDCIKMLLDHGANINAVDNSGKTVLHAAFETYRMIDNDCIKMLLDHGADINAVDNSGKTVLHAAFETDNGVDHDCIKMLLDHGADINSVDNSGKTVLHAAFETNRKIDYDCIKMLLDHGADINAVDNSGKTVLHAAFETYRMIDNDCIKMLLDHGADINAVDNSGKTVLHAAFETYRKIDYDCIKMLLDHGADINAVDNSGKTVLHAAFETYRKIDYDCIKMLLDHGADINAVDNSGKTVLHATFETYRKIDYDCIKMLLDHGADINAVDNSGKTVLHAACKYFRKSSYDCIKTLLDHGADINAVDNSGKTVLHAACKYFRESSYDCIKTLLDHGADINAVDNSGKTVLHAAFETYRMIDNDCIKMLLDHGADINAVDNSGKTVLHAAFETYRKIDYDCIKMLLDHGADINAVDNSGKTVLHAAFETYRMIDNDCIKMLLDHGADINAVDNSGKTVLHAAFETYRMIDNDCIKMLLDHGADINAVDNSGKTVLHAACKYFRKSSYDCIKTLLDHGADINAVNNFGETALHAAFKDPNYLPEVKVILLFLNRGVDANKQDKEQKTALDYAVTRRGSEPLLLSRYRQIVKIMFDATAYGQLMSTDYVTFLHYAVYDGNCVAVELFLENGLDLDNIDVNNQKYPLHFAVENGHLRSDLLLKITKLMRDYKTHCKKCFPKNDNILGILEEYVSNGYVSVSFFKICLFFKKLQYLLNRKRYLCDD